MYFPEASILYFLCNTTYCFFFFNFHAPKHFKLSSLITFD